MAKREHIPAKLRHEVFKRDNYRCRECGAKNKETTLEIDHIVPVSKGESNNITNLQTLCKKCNRSKHTRTWVGGNTESYLKEFSHNVSFNENVPYKQCPNCLKWVENTSKTCPSCGSKLKDNYNNYPQNNQGLIESLRKNNPTTFYLIILNIIIWGSIFIYLAF